jgi:cytosine/adenosine deaminase-related metal-dependent hydrolase
VNDPARQPVLVSGGKVLNPDGELDHPPVADILIRDGRVAAIGPERSIEVGEETRVIDARGMLVTPGFINAHYHSHDVLLRGMFEQLPLEVWGLHSFPSSYPRRSEQEVRIRSLLGAAENLRCGVTTVQDMVSIVGPDRGHVEALISAYQQTGLRAVIALQFGDKAAADTVPFWRESLSAHALEQLGQAIDPGPMQNFVVDLLSERGHKRLTWALGPSAPQRCSEALLAWTVRTSDKFGLPVFTHLYEARSQAVLARESYKADGASLVGFLDRMGLLTSRLAVAHGVWITDAEVARLGASEVNLVCNPISNLKLLNGVAPVRRYADAGSNIALGGDNCSGNDAQNVFETMKSFALWWGLQGEAGETGAAARAFRAATLGGAQALGLKDKIGAIRPGFSADLVFLRLDDPSFVPMNSAVRQLVYAATPRAVHTVMIAGEIVVRDGRLTRFDEAEVSDAIGAVHDCICEDHRKINLASKSLVEEILAVHRKIACHPIEIDRMRLK